MFLKQLISALNFSHFLLVFIVFNSQLSIFYCQFSLALSEAPNFKWPTSDPPLLSTVFRGL